jgi:hypothetical protein
MKRAGPVAAMDWCICHGHPLMFLMAPFRSLSDSRLTGTLPAEWSALWGLKSTWVQAAVGALQRAGFPGTILLEC